MVAEDGRKGRSGPFHEFMNYIAAEIYNLKVGGSPSDNLALKAFYGRYGRAGRDILAFAGGDVEKAKRGLIAIGERMERAGLSYNLDTIAKWFLDWNLDPEGWKRETEKIRRSY